MSGIAQLQQYQDLEAMRQGEPMPVTMTPEARELAPQVAQGIAEAALMFPTGASLPDAMGLQPDPLSDEYYSSMWENLRRGEYVDAALQGLGLGADALTAIGAAGTATGVGAPAGLAAMGAGVGLSGLSTAVLAARRAGRVDPGDIPTPRREITPEQDEEYLDAVRRGDEEEAQRLVDQALVQTGRMAFNPEETTAFTVRTAPPPQRTVTRYKAMRLVDGELRPLYVGATDPVPMGVWLDAKEGGYRFQNLKGSMRVPARTGDVTKIPNDQVRQELIENGFLPEGSKATTIRTVAYRPGWHVGSLPYNPQGGGPRDKGYKKGQADPEHPYQHILGPDIVIAEVELAADRADEWTQVFQDTATRTKAGEIQLSRSGVREVPVDGYYDYTTNPNNYDNPGTWSIGGSLKVNRLLTQQEADTIMREQGFTPQRRVADNIDPNQVDVQRYGVGRSVLYDRQGNPIPLSRRFSAADPVIPFEPIRQENLMRWFGNSVVAEDGKPKMLYHGTPKDFDTFEIGDIGYHFGNREQAQKRLRFLQRWSPEGTGRLDYGPGDTVMPVYLRVENPLRMEDVGEWRDPLEVFGGLPPEIQEKLGGDSIVDEILDIRDMYREGTGYFEDPDLQKIQDEIRDAIKDSGYDGIVYRNQAEGSGDSYIAFDPEQVKSAVGNTGRFDPRNPAITAGVGALAAGTAYSLREQTEQDMENMKNDLREYLRNTPAQ